MKYQTKDKLSTILLIISACIFPFAIICASPNLNTIYNGYGLIYLCLILALIMFFIELSKDFKR